MAERYSRLFTLSNDLYTAGSPVVIAAGALLKDHQTGKVLAQLKLRSICISLTETVFVPLPLLEQEERINIQQSQRTRAHGVSSSLDG